MLCEICGTVSIYRERLFGDVSAILCSPCTTRFSGWLIAHEVYKEYTIEDAAMQYAIALAQSGTNDMDRFLISHQRRMLLLQQAHELVLLWLAQQKHEATNTSSQV